MNATVHSVWLRALAEWRRGAERGSSDRSFIRVTLDEWGAWCRFTGQVTMKATACGQYMVIVE
jgi:hypothetical protein